MAIGNTSLLLDLLNAADRWVADVADGGSLKLDMDTAYTFTPVTTDVTFGFGPTGASAVIDGAADRGEPFPAGVGPRLKIISHPDTLYVSPTGGALRVRKCVTSASS